MNKDKTAHLADSFHVTFSGAILSRKAPFHLDPREAQLASRRHFNRSRPCLAQ